MKRIDIKKNWYFSAGAKYKWEKDHDRRGVGVRLDALRENSELEISVGGGLYTLNCAQAITFARHYKSIDLIKGTNVAIIAKDLLQPVFAPSSTTPEVQAEVVVDSKDSNPQVGENPILQKKLF